MEHILSLKNINKSFGGLTTTDNVSIDIEKGTICGLIGPNGAGKSTLFNIITGNYKADSGRIILNNKNINGLKPHQRARLGLTRTFQNLRLFSNMSVYENIAVSSKQPTLAENIMQIAVGTPILDNKKIYDIIEIFDLGKYVNNTAGSLPYGLQRRLELARCLATNPSFIILDEPIAGMNEAEIQEMGRIIRHINSLGITILLSEHDISFVMGLCGHVFVMDKGKIISSGTPQHVSADPLVREAYFG